MKMWFARWRGLLSIPLAMVFTLAVAGAASAEIAFVGWIDWYYYCLDWPEYCSGGACSTGCYYYPIQAILTVGADGSSVSAVPGAEGGSGPAWSPDGTQIAFERDGEIFVIGAAGGTAVNLTNHPALDMSPAWSPDGSRIAFASDRDGQAELYLMNSDGSGPVRVTQGVGFVKRPAWAPDGARIAFDCEVEMGNRDICAVKADGTGLVRLTSDPAVDSGPAWSPDGRKLAFSSTRTTQQFELYLMNPDGSGVTAVGGGIAGQEPAWSPDGLWIAFASQWQCGGMCLYVVKADGTNLSRLTSDGYGPAWNPKSTDSPTPSNAQPVASFTSACSGLTCSFDGYSSSDLDGTIKSYVWNFGDGTTGSGSTVSHTYAAGGSYSVTLTVTDNGGATGAVAKILAVTQPTMHVGDLDRASTLQPGSWTAIVTITVHDSSHSPVANATARGSWSNGGTVSCTTAASGACTVSKSGLFKIPATVTFTVVNVTHVTLSYQSAANHDLDGDSNGSSITVSRP
jgi:dipeptidyl aminopeptidase/acylaminoacyl peptidase